MGHARRDLPLGRVSGAGAEGGKGWTRTGASRMVWTQGTVGTLTLCLWGEEAAGSASAETFSRSTGSSKALWPSVSIARVVQFENQIHTLCVLRGKLICVTWEFRLIIRTRFIKQCFCHNWRDNWTRTRCAGRKSWYQSWRQRRGWFRFGFLPAQVVENFFNCRILINDGFFEVLGIRLLLFTFTRACVQWWANCVRTVEQGSRSRSSGKKCPLVGVIQGLGHFFGIFILLQLACKIWGVDIGEMLHFRRVRGSFTKTNLQEKLKINTHYNFVGSNSTKKVLVRT